MEELQEYRQFTKPAELHKAVNILQGIVTGINLDGVVNDTELDELINWCSLYRMFIDKYPFSEIIPIVEKCLIDAILTEDERMDILWVCDKCGIDAEYYNLVTSALQQLDGIMHGILCDNILNDTEIKQLSEWLTNHELLQGYYPFDELDSLITQVLSDGKISDDERNMLMAFMGCFVDTTHSYNINSYNLESLREKYSIQGICAICPDITFEDKLFSFTGASDKATRDEIAELITSLKGNFKNSVSQKTDYLIVGGAGNPCWAFACYGRKVEQAMNLRKAGHKIIIMHENDFWDAVEDCKI